MLSLKLSNFSIIKLCKHQKSIICTLCSSKGRTERNFGWVYLVLYDLVLDFQMGVIALIA